MESSNALAIDRTPAPQANRSSVERFEFSATGGEYFRIWIVNLLLTIATLGIYSAWAKVRRLRYFYGSTTLAGSSFEYHGEPLKILKGRLIAAAFLIPYFILSNVNPILSLPFIAIFILAMPFLVVKSRQFQTRMTSWRNIRFGFTGTYAQAAWVFLGMILLVPLTLGLIIPYWIYARHRFVIGQTTFGSAQFSFDARPGAYYMAYLAAAGVVVAMIVAMMFLGGGAGLLAMLMGGGEGSTTGAAVGFFGVFLVGVISFIGYMFIFALIQALTLNAALSGTSVEDHRLKCELSPLRLVNLYITNGILMIITLGLYYPWAAVRLTRYQLDVLSLQTAGSLDEFVAAEQQQVSATGEEVGDLLDADFGL